jgi:hypothetical protein
MKQIAPHIVDPHLDHLEKRTKEVLFEYKSDPSFKEAVERYCEKYHVADGKRHSEKEEALSELL